MTKYKVSELEGALLDAAVAKANGLDYFISSSGVCGVKVDSEKSVVNCVPYEPSTKWSTGGQIIERERIATWRGKAGWYAIHPSYFETGYDGQHEYIDVESGDCRYGDTPLIAAMRAYVSSKFGEEVEL